MTSCITINENSKLVFAEEKSRFEVSNKNKRKVELHKVDDCLITKGIRCDWLLIDAMTKAEVFIELKGGDVEHAVNQIIESVRQLSKSAGKKNGYVICTRNPLSATQVQLLVKKVFKDHKLALRVKKSTHSDTLENVIA